MFEKCLIQHCSPTLAGIKTANLFTYFYSSEEKLLEEVKNCNIKFRNKGIIVSVMKRNCNNALIYVFRKNMLFETLRQKSVKDFLKDCGYTIIRNDMILATLKRRISESVDFPHEVGIFLGYPIEDVLGFIENSGKNFKCTGCWKVYYDESNAISTFKKYKNCTKVYMKLYDCGIPVTKLAVAA